MPTLTLLWRVSKISYIEVPSTVSGNLLSYKWESLNLDKHVGPDVGCYLHTWLRVGMGQLTRMRNEALTWGTW